MNQPLARSILVLFATSALGACATPTYATSLAQFDGRGGEPAARLTPAVDRGEESAAFILAANRHQRPAVHKAPVEEQKPATYTVRKGDTLGKIATTLGVSLEELKEANGVRGTAIDVGQVLKVPGKAPAKEPVSRRAAAEEDTNVQAATYTVRQGDTLGKIATKLGVGLEELKEANGVRGAAISVGQVLKVPGKAPAKEPASKRAAVEEDTSVQTATYTVKKGDTLAEIADKLGVSIAELQQANGVKGSAIHAGQVLKVPGKAPAKTASRAEKVERVAAPETPATYKVRSGDTLFAISKRFGVSMDDLRAANGLSQHAQIHAGQTLKLAAAEPVREEAPARGSRPTSRVETSDVGEGGAAGRVVDIHGPPHTYHVRKGDTLEKVADRLDTDVARLKKDNGLKSSTIHPGQVLKGPRTTVKAYVARSGDTLDDVARRFGVTVEKLRAANGLSHRATIRSGQTLILPAGWRDRGPVATPVREPVRSTLRPPLATPAAASTDDAAQPTGPSETPSTSAPRPSTPTTPRSYTPPATTNGPPLAPTVTPPPTDAQISELGRGRFQWPLKGQIISDFGPKAPGQRNDGINIQANAGEPVRAVAAGEVIYAGDQVLGFGNLVLIKHADGWATTYAHLSRIEVKMQQKVVQGQEIGQVGTSGGVTEPQLHFEVRYAPTALDRARPVDPKLVLPK